MMRSKPYGVQHALYVGLLAGAGWLALFAATLWPSGRFMPWLASWELLACLLLMGAARLLAFRIYRRGHLALDSAFYIAARFIFGAVPTAWLLLLIMSADSALRLWRGSGPIGRDDQPARYAPLYLLFRGGVPALLLLAASAIFGEVVLAGRTDGALAWQVTAFGVAFLAAHYALVAIDARLAGLTWPDIWRHFYLPSVTSELTLVPLALAMVLAYKHQGIGLFAILGTSCFMFGAIFRRWNEAQEKLRLRVLELSALNRMSRTISSSFDRQTLLKNLAATTLHLVGGSSLFMIGLSDDRRETVAYEVLDADGEVIKQLVAGYGEGLSGWVMTHRDGLILGDVQKQHALYIKDYRYNDPRYHSFMAVPLLVYGEVVGVMSVQSIRTDAYSLDHLRVLNIIADQAAIALENSRLYQLATVDGLTGLFVRRYFDQRLVEEWHRAARYNDGFSLGMFDLDHFKGLNDTYGHQIGDQVLRSAAKAVRDNMRSFDLAARYGGEEFAFILPRTSLAEAALVAERIRKDVISVVVEAPSGPVRITASIGLAEFPGSGVHNVAELVTRADAALYAAKAQGRNRVVTAAELGRKQAAVV